MINKIISRYKILKKIGEGGMGEVYLAEDTELGRQVALKFLPTHYIQDPEINTRFKREAKATAALSHPNLITIYDVGEHENKPYIAMEYIQGSSLRDLLIKEELSINKIIDIASQICEGLTEAHRKGIFHRDIKPDNILIDENGQVKIADFGLAKERGKTKVTKTGSTLGTLDYMSPEQLSSGEVDHRSDIWSVGVVIYEMITGRLPFKGDYDAAVSYSIVNEKVEPLARYKSGISEAFQHIIDKALDKEKDTRYQNIADLLTDLKREKKSSVIQKPVFVKKRKHRIPVLAIVALTIFAIIAIFFTGYLLLKEPTRYLPAKHRQVTFDGNIYMTRFGTGDVDVSALSPDGQFLAYAMKKENSHSIMVRDLSGSQPLEILDGFESLDKICWSPDGTKLLFHGYQVNSENEPFGKNYILPRLGGKPQILPPAAYVAWSPDGSKFAGTWTAGPWEDYHPLFLFEVTTGDTLGELRLHGIQRFVALDWSPLSNRIVFLTADEEWHQFTIWTMKSDGTQQQKIVEGIGKYHSPRWSGDGKAIYYLSQNGTTTDLIKINISTSDGSKNSEPLVLQSGLHATGFTISQDNKKLAYTKIETYSNLWSANVIGEAGSPQILTEKLTQGTSQLMWPVLSPNGEKISFISRNQVFVMNTDGTNTQQLTFMQSECKVPSWSPEGSKIAFISGGKVWHVPVEGGKPTQYKNTEAIRELSWSPGDKILYLRPSNQNYHFLDPITSEELPLVTNESEGRMINARMSPDGQNIAVVWVRIDGQNLWIISLEDSSQIRIENPDPWTTFAPIGWSAEGEGIYVLRAGDPQIDILLLPLQGGEPKLLFTLPFESLYSETNLGPDAISMTHDGTRFICSVRESISDMWIIENFDPEIE